MVCLDSDIIIDYLRNDKKTVKKIIDLKESGIELSTTSVNAFELFKGNMKLSNESNKKAVNIFLDNVLLHNFDLESSRKAAEIFENLKSRGEIIDLADIMIASIAIVYGESLLTGNSKHFERIKELKIEKI